LQRGKTDEAAVQLTQLVSTSIEDAQSAAEALQAIRASTAETQQMSAAIAGVLVGQEQDVKETLARVDVVEQSGRGLEMTARGLSDEVRVLTDVAERVTSVTSDVMRASRGQGELAARVGGVLTTLARQVREVSDAHQSQQQDVAAVETSITEIRRFAETARAGAVDLESAVDPVNQKATELATALHRFRIQ
jgi:hypothetical protein